MAFQAVRPFFGWVTLTALRERVTGEFRRPHDVAALVRRPHVGFALVVLAGIVLRFIAWRASQPALVFPDSHGYLHAARYLRFGYFQPSGYPAFLWPLVRLNVPSLIPAIQHALGLGIGVALYALLLRFRVPRWGATLATVPVFLDPLEVNLEQYVLSDLLFETLLVAAIVLFLWRRRPGVAMLAAAGVCLAGATVTRNAGLLLVIVAVVTAIALRARPLAILAFAAAFAVPVGAYVIGNGHQSGHYVITNSGAHFLYARLTPIIDCPHLKLPAVERQLCPAQPLGHRWTVDAYMWSYRHSPQWHHFRVPPGMNKQAVITDFDRRVILQEPRAYATMVAKDFFASFQPSRDPGLDYTGDPFLFRFRYRVLTEHANVEEELRWMGAPPGSAVHLDPGYTRFLIAYQRFIYLPGPVLAVCFALALLALLGVGRARRSGLRAAIWMLTATSTVPVLTAAAVSHFSWRYQLPQLLLLPPAGALAISALLRRQGVVEETPVVDEVEPESTAAV